MSKSLTVLSSIVICCALPGACEEPYRYYLSGNPEDVKPPAKGGFVLEGGAGDADEAIRWMIERSGRGDFVVIRASGADGMHAYVNGLGKVDSVETFVFAGRAASSDPKVIAKIRNAEALFISGGDQWNYVRYWRDTPVQEAINELGRRGVPIGGTSAGLAILGEYYFAAGEGTARSENSLKNPYHPQVTVGRGFLSFPELKGVITDTHFSARDRLGRLLVFMARIVQDGWSSEAKGIGVDEGTAVIVEPGGAAKVVGKRSAYFVRLAGKPAVCEAGKPLSVRAYTVARVESGGRFDLRQWQGEAARYTLRVEDGVVKSSQGNGSIY